MKIIEGLEFPFADDMYHDPNWAPEVIGKRIQCVDGYEKVTGRAKFAADIKLPNMLHAKILGAPLAHAKVLKIDTSKAAALPGVRAFATYEDGIVPERDRYFLVEEVRQYGDPVVAVAADTEEIAEEALELVEVEYLELPIVLDPEEALKPGAPIVCEEYYPDNIARQHDWGYGDVEAGFKQADKIIERRYIGSCPPIQPSENLCCVISYENGELWSWQHGQGMFPNRAQLSEALEFPLNKIHMEKVYSAAGMGASPKRGWFAPVIALLSMKTNRPVRYECDMERTINHAVRGNDITDYKIGFKFDGTITAATADCVMNGGAYETSSFIAVRFLEGMLTSSPRVENFHASCKYVLTNCANNSEFRGYGTPETWGWYAMLDEVAAELDLDPYEFSRKLLVRQWDKVPRNFGGAPTIVPSSGFPEVLDLVTESASWSTKWVPYDKKPPTNGVKKYGIGISGGNKGYLYDPSGGSVKLLADGTIIVQVGMGNFGESAVTFPKQIVAEILGVSLDKITVVWGSTDFTPFAVTQAASRAAVCGYGLCIP
jgi:xanthine dehydrogenase molybdenum-binding subunit